VRSLYLTLRHWLVLTCRFPILQLLIRIGIEFLSLPTPARLQFLAIPRSDVIAPFLLSALLFIGLAFVQFFAAAANGILISIIEAGLVYNKECQSKLHHHHSLVESFVPALLSILTSSSTSASGGSPSRARTRAFANLTRLAMISSLERFSWVRFCCAASVVSRIFCKLSCCLARTSWSVENS